jgi:putative oxidoreductase
MSILQMPLRTFHSMTALLPEDVILLMSRLAIGSVFWRSVQTKIAGWEFAGQAWQFFNVTDATFMLFRYEYALPLLPYKLAAYGGTLAEFFFSLMILLGIGTRFATLGLLGVTTVIQLFVFPEAWPTHILWYALLLLLLKRGGGQVSLDRLLAG